MLSYRQINETFECILSRVNGTIRSIEVVQGRVKYELVVLYKRKSMDKDLEEIAEAFIKCINLEERKRITEDEEKEIIQSVMDNYNNGDKIAWINVFK